jgi:hypothetical protein
MMTRQAEKEREKEKEKAVASTFFSNTTLSGEKGREKARAQSMDMMISIVDLMITTEITGREKVKEACRVVVVV